jgi:Fe-S cluster assembly protein SufD
MIEKLKSLQLNNKEQIKSLENAIAIGIPSMRNEEWKYTYYNKILQHNFEIPMDISPLEKDISTDNFEINSDAKYKLIFIDGIFNAEHSYFPQSPKFSFWNSNNIKTSDSKDFLIELNNALTTDGIKIQIANNFEEQETIEIYYISTQSNQIFNLKNEIQIGKNCQLNFAEYYINPNQVSSYYNVVTHIAVDENAHIEWNKIQDGNEQFYITDNTIVQQNQNAVFTINTITISGAITRNNLVIDINGTNAECNMNGLYLLNKEEHCDNRTKVNHNQPNTNSNELYKGILDEKSTGVFNGKILVNQIAQKTNAFQSNKNIVMSDAANIYTKPQLEIFADDVKCSHGATIAQIEDSELFYLQARGIGKEKAKSLLMLAFAEEIIEKIKNENCRKYLEERIEEKLKIN